MVWQPGERHQRSPLVGRDGTGVLLGALQERQYFCWGTTRVVEATGTEVPITMHLAVIVMDVLL
jgi:hypothetical protein